LSRIVCCDTPDTLENYPDSATRDLLRHHPFRLERLRPPQGYIGLEPRRARAGALAGEMNALAEEVRAAALAKLAVAPTDTLWDVGAGTGSVSVEMALAAPMGQVYAVECDADACALVRQNQAKFAASNLTLIAGKAPEALQNLPAPDAVFIGGSKGNMQAIVDAALAANPQTRLCIAAIALETLQQSIAALAAHGLAAQVTQIAVSRSKAAGSLHLMMANNPVFLIVRE